MTDTDSDMMRRQQNMDIPQTIEGEGRKGPTDLDERDRRDRQEALRPGVFAEKGQQDAVFAQNTRGAGASTPLDVSAAAGRGIGGLVRRGRSLLGN